MKKDHRLSAFPPSERHAFLVRTSRSYIVPPSSFLSQQVITEISQLSAPETDDFKKADVHVPSSPRQYPYRPRRPSSAGVSAPVPRSQSVERANRKPPYSIKAFSDGRVRQIGSRDYSPTRKSSSNSAMMNEVETMSPTSIAKSEATKALLKMLKKQASERKFYGPGHPRDTFGPAPPVLADAPTFADLSHLKPRPFSASGSASSASGSRRGKSRPPTDYMVNIPIDDGTGAHLSQYDPDAFGTEEDAEEWMDEETAIESVDRSEQDSVHEDAVFQGPNAATREEFDAARRIGHELELRARKLRMEGDKAMMKDYPSALAQRNPNDYPPLFLYSKTYALGIDLNQFNDMQALVESQAQEQTARRGVVDLQEAGEFLAKNRDEMSESLIVKYQSLIDEVAQLSSKVSRQECAAQAFRSLNSLVDALLERDAMLDEEFDRLTALDVATRDEMVALEAEEERINSAVVDMESDVSVRTKVAKDLFAQSRVTENACRELLRTLETNVRMLSNMKSALGENKAPLPAAGMHFRNSVSENSAQNLIREMTLKPTETYLRFLEKEVQRSREDIAKLRASGLFGPLSAANESSYLDGPSTSAWDDGHELS
jgi:hypothetical protein